MKDLEGEKMRCVLILMDSLNRRALKAYNPDARGITPNLDVFVKDCIRFDNHYIGSAPCMPARRDLWTGRLGFLERGWGPVEAFDITFPMLLRKEGICTHIVTDHTHYFEIGGENYTYMFDTWQYERGQEFDAWISRVKKPVTDPDSYGKKSPQYLANKERFTSDAEYPSPKTFRTAAKWAQENAGADNFFLQVESFDPHEPFDAPQEFHDLYGEPPYDGPEFNWSSYAPVTEPPEAVERLNNCYLATLSMADKWLGYFLQSLKDNDLYDDTMIILTTDHGHLLGEHGFTGKNLMHAYNELAHIPLFIKLPDGRRAGTREDFITQNIDLMPTILEHFGAEVPDRVQGHSVLRQIEEPSLRRDYALYGWFGRAVNLFDGRYTYFRGPASLENKPLNVYCSLPTTIWRYYGEEYADNMEMGRFLPYTNYPVYRIPVSKEVDISGPISFVAQNELYDLKTDYLQQHPLQDAQIEEMMCEKMRQAMRQADSPAEQFVRLGL